MDTNNQPANKSFVDQKEMKRIVDNFNKSYDAFKKNPSAVTGEEMSRDFKEFHLFSMRLTDAHMTARHEARTNPAEAADKLKDINQAIKTVDSASAQLYTDNLGGMLAQKFSSFMPESIAKPIAGKMAEVIISAAKFAGEAKDNPLNAVSDVLKKHPLIGASDMLVKNAMAAPGKIKEFVADPRPLAAKAPEAAANLIKNDPFVKAGQSMGQNVMNAVSNIHDRYMKADASSPQKTVLADNDTQKADAPRPK